MVNHFRLCLRACVGFVLGLVLCSLPLRAQLDPKLQGSKTDFLNLYQQSTNTKVKPEILTIFDFSGSMEAIMFHPLFVNTDLSDGGTTSYMQFAFNAGTAAVPGNNTYTITASPDGCATTYTTYVVTVNGTGAAGSTAHQGPNCASGASSYTIMARSTAKTTITASATITVGSGISNQSNTNSSNNKIVNSSGGTSNPSPISVNPSTQLTRGTLLTFTTYFVTNQGTHTLEWSADGGATWSPATSTGTTSPYKSTWTWTIPGSYGYSITPISTTTTTFTAGSNVTFNASMPVHGSDTVINWQDSLGRTGTGTSWVWTVPPFDPGTPAVPATPVGTLTTPAANRYSGPTTFMTGGALVKPNGSLVTVSDAAAASASGLTGAGSGSADIRNWVRAASHVRFSTTVGSDLRTVDVPLPWKITYSGSTGNPLSSYTITDREVKTAADGTTTNYGSNLPIEMDTSYSLSSGDYVLSDDGNSGATTVLNTVIYRNTYLTWLFAGTYTDGSYSGKYIVFDAATTGLAGGQGSNLSWGQGYGAAATGNSLKVPQYNLSGTYTGEVTADASVNVVPSLTRVQAVKRAAISTWIQFQADVIWCYRFLDPITEGNNGTPTTIDNNSSTTVNADTRSYKATLYGNNSAWTLLNNTDSIASTNGNSVNGMAKIASLMADNGTPLTYAMARGLAQFTDPASVMNAYETGTNAPSQCMNHFLIVFTDGVDNNDSNNDNANVTSPYLVTTGTGATAVTSINANTGNKAILTTTGQASINRNGGNWNMFNFAAIGAHLGDTSMGTAGVDYMATPVNTSTTAASAANPQSFLPYSIYKRNTTIFTKPHLVTSMTVGVSLGGTITSGPKHALFLTAALGDPTTTSWSDVSTLTPFVWDPAANNGNGGKQTGSIYFFDAGNPDKLTTSLTYAIRSAVGASNINTATNPNTPFIGATLGGEMLIGKFQPPPNGGSIWGGDLLMFGTKLVNDQLQILDKTGAATSTVDASTAQWSAASALLNNGRAWSARKLYTRLPGTSTATEASLFVPFSYTGDAYTALKPVVCQASNNPNLASYPAGSTAQQQVIQWAMGGDTTNLDASGVAKTMRANVMGDIIDSSPAVLEYLYSDVSGSLTTTLSGVGGTRFRLILVGTNQGWLHAFGEVVKQDHATSSDTTTPIVVKGAVDELWSFMPTDFLGYLDQLTVSSNPHRFLVDGTPAIYHLDLPPSGGGRGDGVEEVTSAPGPERAMVLFGLGKGGRSYYALDIHDPFNPKLVWSLVPSEAALKDSSGASLLTARILSRPGAPSAATVLKVVQNLGYSTCTPGIGRLTLTDSTGKPVVRDAVFLGGGFSVPEVEANFPDANNKPTPLGRSVLALDMYTGQILAAVDLTSSTTQDANGKALTPGPIYKGVVPFEFIVGSGMVQRAYFTDFWGGLWSWGSQQTDSQATLTGGAANPTYNYRLDSSDLAAWTTDGAATSNPGIRLVAKDMSGNLVTLSNYTTSQYYYSEALYSTLPAPFRVGSFPGVSKNATGPVPATVGIALESGDRNNPLDYNYTTVAPITRPSNHRLSVVFDRQDSLAWGSVANPILISSGSTAVLNAYPSTGSYQFGDATITPGSTSYYLAPTPNSGAKFGYYRNFPAISSAGLLPKGINTPTVIAGSLFYSYFSPTVADPCTGGTGNTYTGLICDVLSPIVADTRTTVSCASGLTGFTFTGVASDFMALGTRGVIQVGTLAAANPTPGTSQTVLAAETIKGRTSVIYPKARVWRTVH